MAQLRHTFESTGCDPTRWFRGFSIESDNEDVKSCSFLGRKYHLLLQSQRQRKKEDPFFLQKDLIAILTVKILNYMQILNINIKYCT